MNLDALPTVLGALCLVLALPLAALHLARRRGLLGTAGDHGMRVLGQLPLDAKTRLVVVARAGREHLLAVGPAGVQVIDSRAADAAGAP